MRPNIDQYFMQMAILVSSRATCARRKVGCILVNERNHVIATGYNGVAAGQPHCNAQTGFNFLYANGVDKSKPLTGQQTGSAPVFGNACKGACAESGKDLDTCKAIHAEQNALLQCGDVYKIKAAYCTTKPCITCTKLLLNTSCELIIFGEDYPHDEVDLLWKDAGRGIRQLNIGDL